MHIQPMRPFAMGIVFAAAAVAPSASGATPAASGPAAEVCPVPKVAVPRPADASQWPAWVDARVAELQPTPQERKLDRIGWAGSILEAEALARKSNRPVFLFTHDGRMNTGRC